MKNKERVLLAGHIKWHNAEAEYIHRLARGLADRGIDVLVWGRPGSPLIEKVQKDGIPTVTAGDPASLSPPLLRATASFLGELVSAGGISLVNAHRSEGYPVIAWAARRAGAKVVRTRADMRPPRMRSVNRIVHDKMTDHVVVANDLLRENLMSLLGIGKEKITTARMGIDPGELPPGPAPDHVRNELGVPRGAPVVGIMGRLGPVKGQPFVLRAADKVAERFPETRFLVIYRDIEESDKFIPELRRSRHSKSFIFVGPGRDHVGAMRLCDVAVIPSVGSEAHCRVALEWMALAKPVIGSRVGVIPELVEHGDSGFLVQPRYADTIADCLLRLLESPARASRMGGRGRELLCRHHSQDAMVERNLAVFEKALGHELSPGLRSA